MMDINNEQKRISFQSIDTRSSFPNRLEIEDESKTFTLWRKYSKLSKKK